SELTPEQRAEVERIGVDAYNKRVEAQRSALSRLEKYPDLVTAAEQLGDREFRTVAATAGYDPEDVAAVAQAARDTTPAQRALFDRLKPYEVEEDGGRFIDVGRAYEEKKVDKDDLRTLGLSNAQVWAITGDRPQSFTWEE